MAAEHKAGCCDIPFLHRAQTVVMRDSMQPACNIGTDRIGSFETTDTSPFSLKIFRIFLSEINRVKIRREARLLWLRIDLSLFVPLSCSRKCKTIILLHCYISFSRCEKPTLIFMRSQTGLLGSPQILFTPYLEMSRTRVLKV